MKRLLAALGADEGLTRYVGGAIRDDLLKLPVSDIDDLDGQIRCPQRQANQLLAAFGGIILHRFPSGGGITDHK